MRIPTTFGLLVFRIGTSFLDSSNKRMCCFHIVLLCSSLAHTHTPRFPIPYSLYKFYFAPFGLLCAVCQFDVASNTHTYTCCTESATIVFDLFGDQILSSSARRLDFHFISSTFFLSVFFFCFCCFERHFYFDFRCCCYLCGCLFQMAQR